MGYADAFTNACAAKAFTLYQAIKDFLFVENRMGLGQGALSTKSLLGPGVTKI